MAARPDYLFTHHLRFVPLPLWGNTRKVLLWDSGKKSASGSGEFSRRKNILSTLPARHAGRIPTSRLRARIVATIFAADTTFPSTTIVKTSANGRNSLHRLPEKSKFFFSKKHFPTVPKSPEFTFGERAIRLTTWRRRYYPRGIYCGRLPLRE
jgi:hypothetical protein